MEINLLTYIFRFLQFPELCYPVFGRHIWYPVTIFDKYKFPVNINYLTIHFEWCFNHLPVNFFCQDKFKVTILPYLEVIHSYQFNIPYLQPQIQDRPIPKAISFDITTNHPAVFSDSFPSSLSNSFVLPI